MSVRRKKGPKVTFDNAATGRTPTEDLGFRICASKNGENKEMQQISPTLTVATARMLFKSGWRVQVVDSVGRQYAPSEFDVILRFDR